MHPRERALYTGGGGHFAKIPNSFLAGSCPGKEHESVQEPRSCFHSLELQMSLGKVAIISSACSRITESSRLQRFFGKHLL